MSLATVALIYRQSHWVFLFAVLTNSLATAQTSKDWPAVGGDRGCIRYSTLDQITVGNVASLQQAWTWRSGEINEKRKSTIECTPIVVDGVMYVSTGHRKVAALNAATGQEIWRFDPMSLGPHAGPLASGGVNRGVAYWSDGDEAGERRILHGTSDGRLFCLDAKTGKPDEAFGKGGYVLLRDGIEYDVSKFAYGVTSAPAIAGDNVVLGFTNSEGPPPGAPGDIRAWKHRSGANAWGGISVDTQRGLIFAGTGSAGFDFYGGDRIGKNLFANSVLALDGKTGKRRWHFQTLHHDLWDHDLPIYPNLVTVRRGGKQIDAVVQVTKTGHTFLFDRESGKPLFDIEERPHPGSDIEGEKAWPTQPIPVKPPPFARQSLDENGLTNISPQAHAFARKELRKFRSGSPHIPPSLQGSILLPGFHGGANWSGASFDPETGLLFVNSNNVANVTKLIPTPDKPFPFRFAGYTKFLDQEGYPATKPPWGQLSAIDLNRGEIVWTKTLGEFPELTARGIPPTGTESFGGTIVTKGGVVFIAGTMDEKFRAFDKTTGELLWQTKLPAAGYATPCTYRANGRQYVCIAAGGAGKLKTPVGDSFVTFALPAKSKVDAVQIQGHSSSKE